MSWFPLKLIQYFGSQTFSAWGSVISNDQRIKELRRIHPVTLLGYSQCLPPAGPMGSFAGTQNLLGNVLGSSDPRGPKEDGKEVWVEGGGGQPWCSDPQVFLVSIWSDLLGIFSGESWPGVFPDPQCGQRAAKGPSCFSSLKAPSSQAQGHLILPPPGSLPCLPHPQWCPCSLKFHT